MNAKLIEIVKAKGAKSLRALRFAASTGQNRSEIQALTNLSGSLAASYHYDSFGNLVSIGGGFDEVLTAGQLISGAWQTHSLSHVVSANPFTYTGRELDVESGLYYYRARYYDPNSGRFLQEDPFFAENLYPYVENDPINWVDPFGISRRGGRGKGERNKAGNRAGTPNPSKHCTELVPPDPKKVRCKDPHTGKWAVVPRPAHMPYPGAPKPKTREGLGASGGGFSGQPAYVDEIPEETGNQGSPNDCNDPPWWIWATPRWWPWKRYVPVPTNPGPRTAPAGM